MAKKEDARAAFVEYTFRVPREFGFMRQKTAVTLELDGLTPEMVATVFVHGVIQKAGDSAAGEEPGDVARGKMQATWAQVRAGLWKQAGTSVEPIVRARREVLRDALKHPDNAKRSATYKAMKGDDAGERRAQYLDEWFDKLPEDKQAVVDEAAQVAMAEAEAAAKRRAEAVKRAAAIGGLAI